MPEEKFHSKNGRSQAAERLPDGQKPAMSRRSFIKAAGATVAGLVGLSAAGCAPEQEVQTLVERTSVLPTSIQYPAVPDTPDEPLNTGVLRFFSPHEALTVEAFTARLIPGSPEDPGAREAGVVYYIDNVMAYEEGFAQPAYRQPPFAEAYEGDEPPGEDDPRSSFGVIWVSSEEIERYGYQSALNAREVMRTGLRALDTYADQRFGDDFVALSEDQQDSLIQEMVDGDAAGFEPIGSTTFFHVMRRYTAEGMFSDPVYGGNRDFIGWRLVGFPGAQRAYLPDEIQVEGSGLSREIWGLQNMPHFNPGQNVGRGEINPVAGSESAESP